MSGDFPNSFRLGMLSLVLLAGVALPVHGQKDGNDSPATENRVTSIRGPLQRSLFEAYPDSFKTAIDVFWEAGDGWVSQEVFEWWMGHIEVEDRQGIEPRAARFMFERIPARFPIFPTTDERSICAVVGASGNLIGSDYGEFIDAHDVVIRVNRAPIEGFGSDVGVKTTHHVTWPKNLDEGDYDSRAYLLMTPVAANNPEVFDEIPGLVEDRFEWDRDRVRIIHPAFIRYLHVDWFGGHGTYPSTGFVALMIALHVCDEVDVFGFGADAQGGWGHYYDTAPVDKSDRLAVECEADLCRQLEAQGLIKVFRGNGVGPVFDADVAERD